MKSINIEEWYSIVLELVPPSVASPLHRSLRFAAVDQHHAAARPCGRVAPACSWCGHTSLFVHIMKCIFKFSPSEPTVCWCAIDHQRHVDHLVAGAKTHNGAILPRCSTVVKRNVLFPVQSAADNCHTSLLQNVVNVDGGAFATRATSGQVPWKEAGCFETCRVNCHSRCVGVEVNFGRRIVWMLMLLFVRHVHKIWCRLFCGEE